LIHHSVLAGIGTHCPFFHSRRGGRSGGARSPSAYVLHLPRCPRLTPAKCSGPGRRKPERPRSAFRLLARPPLPSPNCPVKTPFPDSVRRLLLDCPGRNSLLSVSASYIWIVVLSPRGHHCTILGLFSLGNFAPLFLSVFPGLFHVKFRETPHAPPPVISHQPFFPNRVLYFLSPADTLPWFGIPR
jgi:hypothetical protein